MNIDPVEYFERVIAASAPLESEYVERVLASETPPEDICPCPGCALGDPDCPCPGCAAEREFQMDEEDDQ